MHLGKMGLMLLVPALALTACGPMTQEDMVSIQNSLNQMNAQNQQIQAQNWNLIQQGQQQMNTQTQQNYNYQRSDGVWVYCTRLSDSVVNCREI